jgi:proteasome lid subunit RPN8/RPN11
VDFLEQLAMDNKSLLTIKEQATACYPNEACGVFVKAGKREKAIACRNISSSPKTQFLMDMGDFQAAADQGEVIGVWHTHVDVAPTPSDADVTGCENTEMPWHILSIYKDGESFRFSEPVVVTPGGHEMPYLERQYVFGVQDCWSLARDFYRREFSIELGDYPRIEEFWKKGHDFFGNNWSAEGFARLVDREPQYGDLFLIQTEGEFPNHIAVYIGDEMIMHHATGRLSRREIFGGYWKKHAVVHLRHKTKC